VTAHAPAYTFSVSEVESTLRNAGHLVYADAIRRAIWCFSLTAVDGSTLGLPAQPSLDANIEVCGHKLAMAEESGLEPISLLKNRNLTPNTINTPVSSSPSGSALDNALRGAQASGGTMTTTGFPLESDAKTNISFSVDSKGYGSIPAKEIYDFFTAAVLNSISQRFCVKTGAIPLDSRSFILPSNSTDLESSDLAAAPIIASLRVHLTTTGSLLLGVSLSYSLGLHAGADGLNSSLPPAGSTVLAAPFGVFGTFQDGDSSSVDGSAAQSPETQITRFRPDADARSGQWRAMCCKLLEMRGISSAILSRSSWLSIQYLRRKPVESRSDGKRTPVANSQTHILWPAVLCFRKRTRSPLAINCTVDPNGISLRDGFDALHHAKHWFLGGSDREELLAKKKNEREAAAMKDTSEANPRLPQQNNGSSPFDMRRASNNGAAAGTMYPTPPDGVQAAAGVTPSIDGTTSSPGNPAPSAALVGIDASISASAGLGSGFGEGWDGSDTKRDQSYIQGENWELNNDVFVDNDITDADFNFFDDENAGSTDVSVPNLSELNNGMAISNSADQLAVPTPQKPSELGPPKINDAPAPPVFAKPELKHARSVIGENRSRESTKIRPSNGVKRQASPFDPTAVYKRLRASIAGGWRTNTNSVNLPIRRGSVYDRLQFDPSLSMVNKKYEHSGRFDFQWENEDGVAKRSGSPPTTDYLRRHGKSRATSRDVPAKTGSRAVDGTGGLENSLQLDAMKYEDSASDADEVSLVSDQDDTSDFSDEPSSPTKLSVRRRRHGDDNESLAPSIRDIDFMDDVQTLSSTEFSKLSLNDHSETSISRYFADAEPASQRPILNDDEFIMVAQILTEQAVSGCLKIPLADSANAILHSADMKREIVNGTQCSLRTLQAILPPNLQTATVCQLRQLLEIQDVPFPAAPSRMQPRPTGGLEQRPSLVQIPPPHLELRRQESRLSVLPSAVRFWETLGLAPSQGPKNVHAICVFPDLDGVADFAGILLERLHNVYESLKLGSFERMPSSASVQNGLVSYEVDKTNNAPVSSPGSQLKSPLVEDMAKLAVAIFSSTAISKNFVIYFVYTPDNPQTIVDACAAFKRLFDIYKRTLADRKKPAQNELVLQLVSLDFIATSTSLVVLQPFEHIRLCLETYDRCTLFGGPMPAPAIVLEQPITRGIDFQIRNPPSANILQENSAMHIAYAQSVDERWITAAWSDNRGSKQMTASYCLGRRGKPLSRGFTDVANEIWTTTFDLISIWKVHWRIFITKVGPMDQQEVSDWTTLAQTETQASVTLTLLAVDTTPSLQLIPAVSKIPITAQSAFYSTPVSTPQSSIVSPEQVGNPTTPKGGPTSSQNATTPGADANTSETDTDASLVDVSDTVWAAIASHRLNVSHSLVDPNPALISGYLIKRGGSNTEDPPAVLEVNVVHSEGNPRMHELLLREMLTYFRGLCTIARARSLTDEEGDVRPWHVAAAEKGVQALYQLM
jgi:mediator of RNA polymerase II transcription subunit 13, fungi type